ncbi:hypothetical protein D3C76_1539800 [compost metagenome]
MKTGWPGETPLVVACQGPPFLKAECPEALQRRQSTRPLFGEIELDLREVTIPVRQHHEEIRGIAIALSFVCPGERVRLRVVLCYRWVML